MGTNYTQELPDANNQSMQTTDTISFRVTKTCTVSYSPDPSTVFPTFLPTGTLTKTEPPTVYGPYTPSTTGSVQITAEPDAKETLCTITVSS